MTTHEDSMKLRQFQEDEVWKRFDARMERMAELNAEYTDEEVEADLQAIDRLEADSKESTSVDLSSVAGEFYSPADSSANHSPAGAASHSIPPRSRRRGK